MSVLKIADGVYSVGVLNPAMRIFDVVMETDYGTSYNAYLITGEKNVLIDTVHAHFFDEYLENIRSVIDPAEIDYIVMNHNEPDHSGSLKRLAEAAPNAKVLASPAGKIYIPFITNNPALQITAVKDGETLDLGGGRNLRFISAPLLHWPDSMFTWLESEKIVFTCDFLGAHFCEPTMHDSGVKYPNKYESAFKAYYDAIFGPFGPYVQNGLAKLEALGAERICTSHGPILQKGIFLEKAKERYALWSAPVSGTSPAIPIFYCSAYGNTGLLANKIAEGIRSVSPDISVEIFDINDCCLGTLTKKMNEANAFLLGSPTINKDAVPPVWSLACGIDAINAKGKAVSAFGSFGWSGEAVPALIARMRSLKMSVFEEGFTCRFVPSDKELSAAFDFGARFAASFGGGK